MIPRYKKVWENYYISPDTCFSYEELKEHNSKEAEVFLELAVLNNKYFRHEDVDNVIKSIKSLLG